MKIYTSYFAKSKTIPKDIVRISICASAPKEYSGLEYKAVAPTYSILMDFKHNYNITEYVERYSKEILSKLDPQGVVSQISNLTGGRDCVLLCYERYGDFCHRHLVAEWLKSSLGIEVKEWAPEIADMA